MEASKRKRIRWRIGTVAETLSFIQKIEEKERPFCHFPDGHQQAIRIQINRDTGGVFMNEDGTVQIVAPWLLKDIFSV